MTNEQLFDQVIRKSVDDAVARGFRWPTRFMEKLDRVGAVPYAKELVASGELQSGLRELAAMGLSELSVEHFVAYDRRFSRLFSGAERGAAKWRLSQLTK